jgi:hypothetical protein
MSLGIIFKGTEGIVLAADSRVTLMATLPSLQTPAGNQQILVPATFDNASKLLRVRVKISSEQSPSEPERLEQANHAPPAAIYQSSSLSLRMKVAWT